MHDWNAYYSSGKDFGQLPEPVLDMILSHTDDQASRTALDIGCGTGQLTRMLASHGYAVTGIDISDEAIERAASEDSDTVYRVFDIEKDPVADLGDPFGLIACKHVYAFIANKQQFLRSVSSLLTSNGTFVLITPVTTPSQHSPIAVDEADTDALLATHFIVRHTQELKSGKLYVLGPRLAIDRDL